MIIFYRIKHVHGLLDIFCTSFDFELQINSAKIKDTNKLFMQTNVVAYDSFIAIPL